MNEQNRNWYEAISLRHSRRKYVGTPVEPEKLERLAALIDELNRGSDASRIALVHSHDGAIFSGIRGGYGIIKGALSYLAFIGAPEDSERDEELGYIGEAAVLEATHLGLGTCWVSDTFHPAAVGKDLHLATRERLLAVSPVGYPKESYSFTEKVMKRAARSHTRKPLEKLCIGEAPSQWPDWARTAAEAARLAPSALNRQPWLFRFDGEELGAEVDAQGSSRGSASKRLEAPRLRHRAQASRRRRTTQPRCAGVAVVRRNTPHCRCQAGRSVRLRGAGQTASPETEMRVSKVVYCRGTRWLLLRIGKHLPYMHTGKATTRSAGAQLGL